MENTLRVVSRYLFQVDFSFYSACSIGIISNQERCYRYIMTHVC